MDPFTQQQEREKTVKNNLQKIKKIIGVHSGKGGVGKTTIAINLACTLAKKYKTGLLDADIDCPNVGKALNINDQFQLNDDNKIIPKEKHGLKIASSAFFSKDEEPLLLRGPMKHHALMEMMEKIEWGDLDYLIIDLPPGTSDVPLTTMQFFPLYGVIFVSTPQQLALLDLKKSIIMAQKMNVNILGVIENMSSDIFGYDKVHELADELKLKFLGSIELRKDIANASTPIVLDDKNLEKMFEEIGRL